MKKTKFFVTLAVAVAFGFSLTFTNNSQQGNILQALSGLAFAQAEAGNCSCVYWEGIEGGYRYEYRCDICSRRNTNLTADGCCFL